MTISFLAQMGWKSALICGAALLILLMLRSRAAADRAAVLRAAVLLLLMLPLIAVALPRLQIEAAAMAPAPAASAPIPSLDPAASAAPAVAAAPEPASATLDPEPAIALAYAAGVLLLGLRLLAGLLTLRRWTALAQPVRSAAWRRALLRVGSEDSPVRLLVSDHAPAPMSWGWRRPVILIDRDTYARAGDAEAILAHEMAHVTRGDWPALMLSRLAVVLFWFNPLVWLVERQALRHAEEAADCAAALRVEPSHYAQTLVSCARRACGEPVPANSIAPTAGDLAVRVKAILDGSFRTRRSDARWTLSAIGACVLFAVPVAAMELVAPSRPPLPMPAMAAPPAPAPAAVVAAAPVPPAHPLAATAAAAIPAPAAPEAPVAPAPAAVPPVPPAHAVAAVAAAQPAAPVPPAPPVPGTARVPAPPAPPATPRVLDVDTLVAMRIHGATPEYAAEMARALNVARVSPDDLVAMRIHGVSARYVHDLAAAGVTNLHPDQLVAMRIHGVRAADARRERGRRLSAEELIERRILGHSED